jgi:hypothetical protein
MDMALLKSILGVIATLVALGLFAFYLKKINQVNMRNKFIKIKEILNITNKTKLAIIEIGSELMLFSISENEVKLVKKISSFEKELKENEKK